MVLEWLRFTFSVLSVFGINSGRQSSMWSLYHLPHYTFDL